jgi:hypothetical protein
MAKETSSKRRAQNGKITSLHQVSYATSLAVADSSLTLDGETIPNNQLPEKEKTETDSKRYLTGSPSLFDGSQHLRDLETKIKELEAEVTKYKTEAETAVAKATKFEKEVKTSKAKARKSEAETEKFKAKAKESDEEVQKLQPARKAFRDIRRAELRISAQKPVPRLMTQKRNDATHGGNLLGDFYVIQEDLKSDLSGGNVLKEGFSKMYELQYEQIALHVSRISQTTQAPILEALNIGANVRTLNVWKNKAATPRILDKVKDISKDYVSWLNLAERSEPQLQKIKNKCREAISMYNKER